VKLHESVELILKQKGSHVHSITPEATVYEALEKMVDKNVGALVVMDGISFVGLISERDYARKVILRGGSSREMKVYDIMSTPGVTVDTRTKIDDCMRLMTEERCRHVVVLDGDSIAGVVSLGDLVNWIIMHQDLTINQLEDYICGRYPS